jgi:hypothetical protein
MNLFKQYLEEKEDQILFPGFNPKVNDLRNKVNRFKVYNNIISYLNKHKEKLPMSDLNWKPKSISKMKINLDSKETVVFEIPFIDRYKNQNLYMRFGNSYIEVLYISQSYPNFSLSILENNEILEYKNNKEFYSKLLKSIINVFKRNENSGKSFKDWRKNNEEKKKPEQPRLIGKPLFTADEINEIIKNAIEKYK